ncbi:winged helix-turn-helix domain-containing protein [Rhizobium sp. KVB221]|uniref:Winged helix-turn-helix domain-containing protein n=1 Tax=Rhizobium setariae TaxID=2801340 RepID=A0A937CMR7_9HYPH|nr:winged helix-turn-helix domain-containing tetratricopeptide repeat protein [Rhizobium setariae]MBL0373026.1 winged helix-turn-helix domain-containing protein [Rhizobium setariae]
MAEQRYAFGQFHLDPASGELKRDGEKVALGQRGTALLKTLLEADGQPIGKDALIEAAWPGTIVEEGNLSVQVASLRKVLGLRPDGQDWIVTVPRLGYRLVKPTIATPGDMHAVIPTLAVLPFDNLSGDPEQAYFTDGIVDDIITALSRFKSFAVVARNSSFAYRGHDANVLQSVASDLGVRYVLEGSLRKSGDRLRISAQLVDTAGNVSLWARKFDGDLSDVFEFQDRITEAVAIVIEPELHKAELERLRRERPSGSMEAYDIYLQALAKILTETAQQNAEAHELLERALALEPANPNILALASYVLEHRKTVGWPPFGPDDNARCFDLARRGLEHADGDTTVMAICGMSLIQVASEYDWGMAVLQAAVDANPNNIAVAARAGVGHLLCGDLDRAVKYLTKAHSLSPRDPYAHITLCGLADVELVRGNFEQSIEWAMRALALNPNFDPTLWMLIAANTHLGRPQEAKGYLEHLQRISPGITIASIEVAQNSKAGDRLLILLEGLRQAGLPES